MWMEMRIVIVMRERLQIWCGKGQGRERESKDLMWYVVSFTMWDPYFYNH